MQKILFLVCCVSLIVSCSPDTQGMSAEEIAAAVQTEDEVEQKAPYGLSLFPDAVVTMAISDGRSIAISTMASVSEVSSFYSAELERNSYDVQEVSQEDGKATIKSVRSDDPSISLVVGIRPSKTDGNQIILNFLQFDSGER